MLKLCLLLGVCLVAAMAAESREHEMEAMKGFFECDAMNMRSDMEENKKLMEEGRKCFLMHHCKPEETERERKEQEKKEHEKKEREEHFGSGSTPAERCERVEKMGERMKYEKCHKEVEAKEHKQLSECVKKATGHDLPEDHGRHEREQQCKRGGKRDEHHSGHHSGDKKDEDDHKDEHHSGWEHSGFGSADKAKMEAFMKEAREKFLEKLEKSCGGNKTHAEEVEGCLMNLMKIGKAKTKGFCTTRKSCFESYEHPKINVTELKETFKKNRHGRS